MREKGANTRVIDAGGGSVLPGFIEGHKHLFAGAAELEHLQLYGTRGFDELKARMLADVVLLPVDLEKTDPASFKGIMPRVTVCDGGVVFEGTLN